MGTRCLVRVYDKRKLELCNLYFQFDGYPSSVGMEIADFLSGRVVTDGPGRSESYSEVLSNGMDELAAQLVTYFKGKYPRGNVYLHPCGQSNVGENYTYNIFSISHIEVQCNSGSGYTIKNFESLSSFRDWCNDQR